MIPQRHFRWLVLLACLALMITPASAQRVGIDRSGIVQRLPIPNADEQALARGRAAMNANDFARAFAEYRVALNALAPTAVSARQHDEALRGFSESGVKLAQQRLSEGRAPEAEHITREVLSANANYRPALELLARLHATPREAPVAGGAPPPKQQQQQQQSSVKTVGAFPRRILEERGATQSGSGGREMTTRKAGDQRIASAPAPSPAYEPRFYATPPPSVSGAAPVGSNKRAERITTTTSAAQPPTPTSEREESTRRTERSTPAPVIVYEGRPVTASPAPSPAAVVRVKQPLVKVFFATDRNHLKGAKGPSEYFGTERNREDGDHLRTGFVTVSIPPGHKEGRVERPFTVFTYEVFAENAKEHVVLTDLKEIKGDDFYSTLASEYNQREAEKRSAFVFIHGFNVDFDHAAYRTAQLAYDLDFEGVPIMYSWPSQGSLRAYNGDEETVSWSSPHLQGFLERLARESGALRIHLIAHSMGNRLLTKALVEVGRQPDIQPLFENVIMAAPDVNANEFSEQIWPGIKKAAKRFTLYASSDDRALRTSRRAKGSGDFDRLGEGGENLVVISGLDTVDASGIDTSLLGHSYIDCKPVMNDLQLLIEKGFAPLQRKLRDHQKQGLAYWGFR